MPAAYQDLYIEQGTTYSTSITIDDVYNDVFDLSGFTAQAKMKTSYYTANTTAVFSTTINSGSGTITLTLDAPTTSNITPGRYVFDAIIIDPSQNVTRILEGIAQVAAGVTLLGQ
jgi:hypothetical protein